MTNKMSWYFEIAPEAGWAVTDTGENAPCYTEYKMEFQQEVDESKVTKTYEEQAGILAYEIAKQFQIPLEWVKPISEEEYILKTEGDGNE